MKTTIYLVILMLLTLTVLFAYSKEVELEVSGSAYHRLLTAKLEYGMGLAKSLYYLSSMINYNQDVSFETLSELGDCIDTAQKDLEKVESYLTEPEKQKTEKYFTSLHDRLIAASDAYLKLDAESKSDEFKRNVWAKYSSDIYYELMYAEKIDHHAIKMIRGVKEQEEPEKSK